MTAEDRLMLARGDVMLYARRLTLGTATVQDLVDAFKRYDEAKAANTTPETA